MSNINNSGGGSGPGGVITIDGDNGSATGPIITFDAQSNAGATVSFDATGSTVSLIVTAGANNTFVGNGTGNITNTSNQSSAFGSLCMPSLTSGNYNNAFGNNGQNALQDGSGNVSVGTSCLFSNVSGNNNFSLGFLNLFNLNGGSGNISIGRQGGFNYTSNESLNILIGDMQEGVAGESGAIRIGRSTDQTSCYIQGIAGVSVSGSSVLVDSATGQLGVLVSSERYKKEIVDMEDVSSVLNLRPVNFVYKQDTKNIKQYGLIAEEVNEVMPSLVLYDKEGRPDAIKYHELPILLLSELHQKH